MIAALGRIRLIIRQINILIWHYPHLVIDSDYDAYWHDKRGRNMGQISAFQKQRADWLLPRIEPGSSVLDIGCGDGAVLLYLQKHLSFQPIAADISDYALNFLRSKGITTIKFDANVIDDIQKLPEIDYLILFEVLEHMPDPEQFLKTIEPKLRKAIFFSFPNTGYFPYRLRLLFGSFVMQWRLHPGEHLRFWTYRDLKWWLKELGYWERSTIHVYEGIPGLNRLWGSLFGMAFVGEIKCE